MKLLFAVMMMWISYAASEREVRSAAQPPPPPPRGCPVGWQSSGSSCYMFNTTIVDFNEAEKACGDQSGYLVKIDDDSEQKFIHEQIKSTSGGLAENACRDQSGYLVKIDDDSEQKFIHEEIKSSQVPSWWIGLHDIPSEGVHRWVSDNSLAGKYTHWASGQPNDAEGGEDCVALYKTNVYHGKWYDRKCSYSYAFICEKPALAPPPPPRGCPVGWQSSGSSCYMFNTTTVDFNEAEKACGDQSGYLVKIDDDSEQKFIHEQIKSTSGGLVPSWWIGLHDIPSEKIHRWISDNSVANYTYTHWASGQPNNGEGGEDCVAIWKTNGNPHGKWYDRKCSYSYAFICEKPALGDWKPRGCYQRIKRFEKVQITSGNLEDGIHKCLDKADELGYKFVGVTVLGKNGKGKRALCHSTKSGKIRTLNYAKHKYGKPAATDECNPGQGYGINARINFVYTKGTLHKLTYKWELFQQWLKTKNVLVVIAVNDHKPNEDDDLGSEEAVDTAPDLSHSCL
ncbi:chromatin-modulating protein mrc1 [Desmophyllum pertusum]|uniref:Chromatin-modulating protein mrc1 n=1 Tax=Desmophyllum pertusum TaxID=174260 RepID=A0A9X0D9L6_9CNID|nr:chromatin-modulating protein mrc1 [Desmophyllum pertusum]